MICGKLIYVTRQAAKKAIDADPDRRLAGMYWCAECPGWHVHSKQIKAKMKGGKGQRVEKSPDTTPNRKTVNESLKDGDLRIHNPRTFKIK